MRKLLAFAIVAAALWGGYWFVGSAAVERGLVAWLDARRADGWVAEYDSLNTAGFPNRFDTTITGLTLSDPALDVTWKAPLFQILALSYRPNHIIVALPHTQTLETRFQRVDIASTQMRGSVVFRPGTALAPDRATIVMDDLTLDGSGGWSVGLAEGRLATRRTVALDNAHDVAFTALGLAPTAAMLATLDPDARLPKTVDTLKIDTTVTFDAPWDRFALEGDRPQITAVTLKLAQATWGALDLRAAGQLTVDSLGVPSGRITVTITNWRDILGLAVAGGLVPADIARTVERGLSLMAGMSGDPTTLEAPLSFQNGFVSFGPVPLGPAPRLR